MTISTLSQRNSLGNPENLAPVVELHVHVDGGPECKFVGRFAWTLNELIRAGDRGCTPVEQPAPRWSHDVFRLRRDGVQIDTITEPHAGAYSGHHARYRLDSEVQVLKMVRAGEDRHGA
jgi:winged helix domain-containing protein